MTLSRPATPLTLPGPTPSIESANLSTKRKRKAPRGLAPLLIVLGIALILGSLFSFVSQRQSTARALAEFGALPLSVPTVGLPADGVTSADRDLAGTSFAAVTEPTAADSPPLTPAPLPLPELGALIGRVTMSGRGIDAPIRHGAEEGILRDSAGHVPGTALPGAGLGNIVLAAHRDSLFANLKHARIGDEVTVESITAAGERSPTTYRIVSAEIVDEHQLSVLDSTEHEVLTLLTCYPFDYVGHAPSRYVIRAVPVVAVAEGAAIQQAAF